jgi:diacylglycerol kinase (ATP)
MEVIRGFIYAFRGLTHILKNERNARIHLFVAIAALLLGFVLGVSDAEQAAIFFAIIIVFVTEIVNTAIEETLDLIEPNHNAKVALVKDMAAASVLVASIGAVIIGAVIFGPYLLGLLWTR